MDEENRKRLERLLEQKRQQDMQRKQQEQLRLQAKGEAIVRDFDAWANRENRKKHAEHQRRFRCHVRGCNYVSLGPRTIYPGGDNLSYTAWDVPTGHLGICELCGKWTCEEHAAIYNKYYWDEYDTDYRICDVVCIDH